MSCHEHFFCRDCIAHTLTMMVEMDQFPAQCPTCKADGPGALQAASLKAAATSAAAAAAAAASEAASAAAAEAARPIVPGDHVIIRELTSRPALNGSRGTVLEPTNAQMRSQGARGRLSVRIDGERLSMSLARKNLVRAAPEAAAVLSLEPPPPGVIDDQALAFLQASHPPSHPRTNRRVLPSSQPKSLTPPHPL